MTENFIYISPPNDKYLKALLQLLEAKGETSLLELLKNSTCSIEPSSSFSRQRWNGLYTTIYFSIPTDDFTIKSFDEENKAKLIEYCDLIMPKNVGYDVMHVEISPSIETELTDTHSFESDIDEIIQSFNEKEEIYIPEDVLMKGKEMMRVYYYLYVIENFLRLFIEKIFTDNYGEDYIKKIILTKKIRDTIKGRKQNEEKNHWVRIRGNSELFYLDFIELGLLIQNNWDLFKEYFPEQSWINSKLNDLVDRVNERAEQESIEFGVITKEVESVRERNHE